MTKCAKDSGHYPLPGGWLGIEAATRYRGCSASLADGRLAAKAKEQGADPF